MRNLLFNILTSILFFLIPILTSQAQVTEIKLKNPSFEDFARPGNQPRGWYDCGDLKFPSETPPDVHPSTLSGGVPTYGVDKKPKHGDTYLGMVIRETGSYESVSQRLESELIKGNIYSFTLSLCMSKVYKSAILKNNTSVETDFITPVYLNIYGGEGFCDTRELLATSPIIANTKWEDFTFLIEPKNKDLSFIVLEVGSDESCNGHLLIDNVSSIILESKTVENISTFKDQIKMNKDSLNLIAKSQRLAEIEITAIGSEMKFNNNKLTFSANRKIRSIANIMKNMSDYKLIIDFNGLKKKKAKLRKEEIEKALLDEGLDWLKYEIRNTEEEDDLVKWLVDDNNMYIGILEIDN